MTSSAVSAEQSSLAEKPVENEYEDSEKNYQPKSLKFWAVLSSVYLSIFLVALDRTIIATAIPRITDEFNSIEDIGWYGSAYMLTAASFLPMTGRIYKYYSTKWIFLISIIIFEIGSAVCGAAPSSSAFIAGRAIAGLGSAGIFNGGMLVIVPLVPLRKRPIYTSISGIAFGVSSVIGPLVGGAFTDKLTWRWCFYLNLPIGGFVIVAVLLFFHVPPPKHEEVSIFAQIKNLDPVGALFFVPSIVCLLIALQWGGSTYPWSAPKIIGLLLTFAVLFVIFIVVEVFMPETAMAPTRVVLNRSVAGSMLFMFLIAGAMMSLVYYLTIWFQAVKGDSALESGVSTIPMILSMIVLSIPAAVTIQKTGYYVPALLISPVLCATACGLLSTLTPTSGHSKWIGYQIIFGFGLGFGFQTSTLVPQNVLSRDDVPLGLSLVFLMQQLGGAIFVSVSQNVFSDKLIARLSGLAGLDAETIVNTGATDIRNVVPVRELVSVVDAFNYALTRVFLMAAILSACMIIGALAVEWKRLDGKKGAHGSSEEGDAKLEESKGKVKQ